MDATVKILHDSILADTLSRTDTMPWCDAHNCSGSSCTICKSYLVPQL